jgi:cytidine deaminase
LRKRRGVEQPEGALIKKLLTAAARVALSSYSPYSGFRVGAALLCADGTIAVGTNVENRSFGLTICAERSAISCAVAQGKTRFSALAVVSPDADYPVPPCGACRQVISEFVEPGFPVYLQSHTGETRKTSIGELLPLDSLRELKAGN